MDFCSTFIQITLLLSYLAHQIQGYNILAHWSLNGTEQGISLHGGPTFVEGRYPGSKAINFNQPSNCFARIPKLELRGRSFTIAAWVQVSSILNRDQYIFSDWYDPWQFGFMIQNNVFLFTRHSSAQPWYEVKTIKVIDAGKWTHVAVTWNQDAGVVKLFVDTKEEASKEFSTATVWKAPTRDKYQIGDDGHPDNHQFLGSVMDLYIIEGVLNAEQLEYLRGYNILAHWSLNGTEQGISLHGGPTFVEGRYPGSKAINFNQPSNCFARIPKLELRGRSFTIAAWVQVSSILNRDQYIFSDWYDPWQFGFMIQNNVVLFMRHSSAQPWYEVKTIKVIEAGKWTHVAVTWNQEAGVVKLFIHAKEEASNVFSTGTVWNAPTKDTYEIGDDGHPDNHQFLGSVMDLYIIEGVLNSEQLKYLRGFLQISSSINNTVVYTNETVQCRAIGSPTPYVAWELSGAVLVNKTSTAEITITENNGEYVCVASNREGIEKLIVNAKAPLQLCHDHLIITDVSRAVNHPYQSSQSNSDVTDIDLSKWYRIQSPAGNQLPTTCVPQNNCGTQAPGWLNGAHPSVQDGIVKRTVCFHFNGDCCYHNTTVQIRKCLGFYVYKFSPIFSNFHVRYCIDDKPIDKLDVPSSIFKDIRGVRLDGHVIHRDTHTDNHYDCMTFCLLLNSCKSYNYNNQNKICELNDVTHREVSLNAMENNHAFAYYEKLLAIIMRVD